MSAPAAFQEYPLYARHGVQLGRVSVPCTPRPPILIQWGNKFFIRPPGEGRYVQFDCYLVPLEHMYPVERAAPQPKSEGRQK